MNVVDPSPETKLSSAEDVPPPPHPVSAIANAIRSAIFFITYFQAKGDVLALNMLTLK
jgi:hypothetical protein